MLDDLTPPRRTIVTGASQPLGMALVRTLLERGQHVVAIAPRPERVPALTDLAQDVGDRLRIIVADATHGVGAAEALGRAGPCDALVHAAVRRQASDGLADLEVVDALGGVSERDFATLMAANAWASLAWVRASVPMLAASPAATVLVVVPWLASLAGKSHGGDYAYCASLAARLMVVRALAADLSRERITVAAVNPGNYKTDLEGPSFQHSVLSAAVGVADVLSATGANDAGTWKDWTGAVREGW